MIVDYKTIVLMLFLNIVFCMYIKTWVRQIVNDNIISSIKLLVIFFILLYIMYLNIDVIVTEYNNIIIYPLDADYIVKEVDMIFLLLVLMISIYIPVIALMKIIEVIVGKINFYYD